jgi:hypothetical protein
MRREQVKLNNLTNASLATMARIGSMISTTAPFLWTYLKRLGGCPEFRGTSVAAR